MTLPSRVAPTVPGDPAVRLPRPPRAVAALVILLAIGLGIGSPSHGVEGPAEIDPTGGLRSRAVIPQSPALGVSREELVRQWDLDGNGTIDASEANVARARMRRARMETELGTGIDPLTGKPRVVSDEMPEDAAAETAAPGAEAPEPRPRAADDKAPPGTRVPKVGPTPSGPAAPRLPSTLSSGSAAAGKAGAARSSAAGPAPTGSRPGALTGGARAGAPAARSGYGSLAPKPDLNAGLPRSAFGRPVLSGTGRPARGGFLPSVRSPLAPRPTTPLAPPTPRVTADDIGGF